MHFNVNFNVFFKLIKRVFIGDKTLRTTRYLKNVCHPVLSPYYFPFDIVMLFCR